MTAVAVYWDSSAIVAALLPDAHSKDAIAWASRPGLHLLSSLTGAEYFSVLYRLIREGLLGPEYSAAGLQKLDQGPWTRLNDIPQRHLLPELASRWRLKGADLWHLALAKTLQQKRSDLVMLSYDARLQEAAKGEGLAP